MNAPDHPVAVLEREHQVILSVLDAVDRRAAAGPGDPDSDRSFWVDVSRFLAGYADDWHHKKEEDLLFPVLAQKDLGCGPIPVMLAEHEQGRALRADLGTALQAGDLGLAARTAATLSLLLRDHIAKEDQVLFQMARHFVEPGEIRAGFDALENGPDAVAARDFEALAQRLAAQTVA